jgi:ABC-type multidrug transport system fused ATPase/permease subunit
MTIKENLKIAKSNATDEEIYESLEKANALDFIK